uniref:Secreted protein n=1 Tax=Phakopsora pachyrhizi TaxID=170000 RepID=A0A0S1MIW6_PHAPC
MLTLQMYRAGGSMLSVFFLLSCLFGVYTSGEGVFGNTNAGRLPHSKEQGRENHELSSLDAK